MKQWTERNKIGNRILKQDRTAFLTAIGRLVSSTKTEEELGELLEVEEMSWWETWGSSSSTVFYPLSYVRRGLSLGSPLLTPSSFRVPWSKRKAGIGKRSPSVVETCSP